MYYAATFDRSGRYVITGSDDRLVKIWSMETAYCLASCRGHEVSQIFNETCSSFSSSRSLFHSSLSLSCILCRVCMWFNFSLGLWYSQKGDITDLAVSFNNTLVASSSNDCIIRVVRALSYNYKVTFFFFFPLFFFWSWYSIIGLSLVYNSGDCQMVFRFQFWRVILELLLL